MAETILKVKNLRIQTEKELIIKDLSFEVKEGEFLVILGANGAGKTTLLKAILGLIPYQGEITWLKKLNISYLPERLDPEKFRNSLILVKEFFQIKEKSEKRAYKFLKAVGLNPESIFNKNPGRLSSGQFQRMLIAWSLVSEPDVLFFDEPATGIDVGGEETIYSLLRNFWEEKNLTVFLVTHDLEIVYKYASRVLCLSKRGFYCSGSPKEVLTPKSLQELYGTEIKFYKHNH